MSILGALLSGFYMKLPVSCRGTVAEIMCWSLHDSKIKPIIILVQYRGDREYQVKSLRMFMQFLNTFESVRFTIA